MYVDRVMKVGLFAMLPVGVGCVTELSTSTSALHDQPTSSINSPSLNGDAVTPRRLQGPIANARVPGAGLVGYYDTDAAVGLDYEVPPIVAAGGTAITVNAPTSAELANLNVLFVTNPDNGGFGSEYVSLTSDIAAAVQSGMVLVIHDRAVFNAASILPSGASFGIFRDFSEHADIEIRDGSTAVTANLDNSSLDGGSSSNHGFALDSTLPARAKLILTSTSPSHVVTFCYPVGRGSVIYSTIPLDFYLVFDFEPATNLRNFYAPNVVRYAIAGACSLRGPRPTPNIVN